MKISKLGPTKNTCIYLVFPNANHYQMNMGKEEKQNASVVELSKHKQL
jgi:hypothetical protein